MAVLLVYSGLVMMVVGAIALIGPFQFLGIGDRLTGRTLLGAGALLALPAALFPASVKRWPGTPTRIDDLMPTYHFHEVHAIRVRASPGRVFRAIKDVTPQEIRFLGAFMVIRSFGRAYLPKATPFLETFSRWGYRVLVDEPDRELVAGGIIRFTRASPPVLTHPHGFLAFADPGCAKVTLSFYVEDLGEGWSSVTTQTRVLGTDRHGRLRFGAYWRLIYPGSAIIRRMMLRGIKLRAEQVAAT